MALVKNCTAHPISFGAYDAGGLWLKEQKWPDIPPMDCRYIDPGNMGEMDYCIVLAYMTKSNVPGQVGLTQTTQGGGLGLEIAGFGGSMSVEWTSEYSTPLAAVRVGTHEMWDLFEKDKTHSFSPGGPKDHCNAEHGY